jgi:hypothetical protein
MQPRKCVTATVKGSPSPRLMRLNPAITFGATQTDAGVARQFSPGPGRVVREWFPICTPKIQIPIGGATHLARDKKSEKKLPAVRAQRHGEACVRRRRIASIFLCLSKFPRF